MRKIVFPLLALLMVLGLSLSIIGPADAQETANSVDIYLGVDPASTHIDGTIYYTITLQNADITGAHNATVNVTFCPPDNTGAIGSYGPCVPIGTDVYIAVNQTICYNYDGSGGCIADSRLEVDLSAIPLDPGVDVAYGRSAFNATYDADPVYTAAGQKNIPVVVISDPATDVGISLATVIAGEEVELTITEANTGSVDLTNVHVEVEANGVLIADLDDSTASGDSSDPGVLNPTETWSWVLPGVLVNGPTTFVAIGYGTDPGGNVVTYCETEPPADVICDDNEMATVSVNPPGVGGDVYPIDKTNLLVPWIGLAVFLIVAAGAGVLVLRRRRSA